MEDLGVTTRFGRQTARAAGSGDETLVLLHGVGGNADGWVHQFDGIGREFRVVAWNAPGYRDSSPLQKERPELRDYAEAVVALLDALELDRVHLLGHSFGGLVASRVAADFPRRVDRLILADCSSGHRRHAEADRQRTLAARRAFSNDDPETYARARVRNLLSDSPDPETIERAVRVLCMLRQPGFSQASTMISEADIFEHAARIAARTRVICGVEDKVTPERLNREIAAAIHGADYVPIANAGHWSFLENPVAFNDTVLAFLSLSGFAEMPAETAPRR